MARRPYQSAPKATRGRPKGRYGLEALAEQVQALPGGAALFRELRRAGARDSEDEWKARLREAIARLEGR